MQDLDSRPVREDEFAAVLEVARAAFGKDATAEFAGAWAATFPYDRSLAVYDRGRMVATSVVLPLELTVPGGQVVPMGGVTWVSTLPTHRRRGILRRLLEAQFAAMAERGEFLSGLSASEGLIYGRFGYGPASSTMSFSVERAHSKFRSGWRAAKGERLTLLDSQEAAVKLPGIYDSLRARVPGAVSRTEGLWQAYFADPPGERGDASHMLYVMRQSEAGEPDGYASYRVKNNWRGAEPDNEVRVVEVVAGSIDSYAALWRYLLDTDLATTITCAHGHVDEPLRWLLADPRRFTVDALYDSLWLHIHNVPRALAARRYASAGTLVLEVAETFPVAGTSRYLLTVESDRADAPPPAALEATASEDAFVHAADCVVTTRPSDLALDASVLAMVYLGGATFAALAAAGRIREVTPGALALADAMFTGGRAPFCATDF